MPILVEPESAAHRDLDRFGRMVQRPRVGLPAEKQALVLGQIGRLARLA
jgi:hypothetical protein